MQQQRKLENLTNVAHNSGNSEKIYLQGDFNRKILLCSLRNVPRLELGSRAVVWIHNNRSKWVLRQGWLVEGRLLFAAVGIRGNWNRSSKGSWNHTKNSLENVDWSNIILFIDWIAKVCQNSYIELHKPYKTRINDPVTDL